MKSQIANRVGELLVEAFPFIKINEEYSIKYQGQQLFVDFFIPQYLIAVEVHGKQHDVFVEHYHKDAPGWRAHKNRDRLKEEWADVNNITYVVIREEDMPKNKEEMIIRCQNE